MNFFRIVLPGQHLAAGEPISGDTPTAAVTTWATVEHRNRRLKSMKVAVIDLNGIRNYFRLELLTNNTFRVLRAFR